MNAKNVLPAAWRKSYMTATSLIWALACRRRSRTTAEDIQVTLQSENGFLGLGPLDEVNACLVNAGGQPCGMIPGAAMFDSCFSFALIRGDMWMSVCSAVCRSMSTEISPTGWCPEKWCGMGGAMDLVAGAKKVIIAMEHCAKMASRSCCTAAVTP